MDSTHTFATIDEYIDTFPEEVRQRLRAVRQVIRETAPEAEETIKYRMPTLTFHGNLVHFAAFKDHIGLYPTTSPMEAFREQLAGYKTAKGTIRFPMDQPLPLPLIREIVEFRVRENAEKQRARRKRG